MTGERAVVGVIPFGAATSQLGGWADNHPTAAAVGKAEFDVGGETRFIKHPLSADKVYLNNYFGSACASSRFIFQLYLSAYCSLFAGGKKDLRPVQPAAPGAATPIPPESLPPQRPKPLSPFDDGAPALNARQVEKRRRQDAAHPVRSLPMQTMCCVASVVSLTRSEAGTVQAVTLLAFQR